MKIINPYSFGVALPSPNTFIGGVGATSVTSITDFIGKTSGITAANIFNFQIDSNDNVSFFCDASYTLNTSAFFSDNNITYYIDEKCTFLSLSSLKFIVTSTYFYFPNVTGTGASVWQSLSTNVPTVIVIPLCTPIGGAVGDNLCFNGVIDLEYVITHVDNETNNGGSPDGDLTAAGIVNIKYVTNTTPPSDINNLAVDTVFGSLLEISWTAPSATNPIIYYEVWVDDAFIELTTSTSFIISGLSLNTSYEIKVRTLDEFGNRGESNVVNQTTAATYQIPTGDIVSYYPLNTNSNDSVGTNNGTDTDVSYVSGYVGNAVSLGNSASSLINLGDADAFSFTNGSNDLPASVSFWVKLNRITGVNQMAINKLNTSREWYIHYLSGDGYSFYLESSTNNRLIMTVQTDISISTWTYITVTYDGSETEAGMKIYYDAIPQSLTSFSNGTYVGMTNGNDVVVIGNHGNQTTDLRTDGLMDEVSIFNIELSAIQIFEIKAKNDAGLGLTD